jgi:hypothetical protein
MRQFEENACGADAYTCIMPGMKKRKPARRETVAELQQEFLAAVSKLWPVAGGSLSLRKNSCIREHCAACASGAGHPHYGLWGRNGARRFGLYVPEELAPELEQAVENGRALQQLITEMGLRYTKARKSERSERQSKQQSSKSRRKKS